MNAFKEINVGGFPKIVRLQKGNKDIQGHFQ